MFKKPRNWFLGLGVTATLLTTANTAQAAIIQLSATLDQEQEVPTPIAVPEASGSADILYDTEDNLLSWDIMFDGLSGPAVGLHFHGPASPGDTAPVVVDVGNISGLTSPSIGSTNITEIEEEQLLSGLWYINVHTELNTPGEIRGQVTVNTVPEPSTLGFLGMAGITFLGSQLRKKRAN